MKHISVVDSRTSTNGRKPRVHKVVLPRQRHLCSVWFREVVNHGRKEYVKGGNFTNTIEGFWATLKRMIEGIYHSITSKYLQRYIDEAVYRYNTRKTSGSECFKQMFVKSIGVVDYKVVQMLEMAA